MIAQLRSVLLTHSEVQLAAVRRSEARTDAVPREERAGRMGWEGGAVGSTSAFFVRDRPSCGLWGLDREAVPRAVTGQQGGQPLYDLAGGARRDSWGVERKCCSVEDLGAVSYGSDGL